MDITRTNLYTLLYLAIYLYIFESWLVPTNGNVDHHALMSSLIVQGLVDTIGLVSITSITWIYRPRISKELVKI
jgi:hypothetical protein